MTDGEELSRSWEAGSRPEGARPADQVPEDEADQWEVEQPPSLRALMHRKLQERREAKARWRKVRLRGLDWFPPSEGVPGRHGVPKRKGEAEADEALIAALYLISVVAVPSLIAFALWHPWPLPDALYGLPIAAAGLIPWLMTQGAADLARRKHYSSFTLKAQTWLQLGGAAPSAVRCIRRWRSSARRSGLVGQEGPDQPESH